ncbi:hypothetical protein Tco_0304919 [Tanacetum coccineum]
MDPMISLGQKYTLVEYMILFGADNRPPMFDKDLYDFWKSRMELYMQNREHDRMILESVEHGPLIWPTVDENGVIRTKKYVELSTAEKIQADCDMKATNIILQGLPTDIYSLVNHHRVAKDLWERVQLLILPPEWSKFVTDVKLVKDLHTSNFDQLHVYIEQHELHANEVRFVVPVFSPGDDPIACLNKAMAFLTAVASSREDKGKIIPVILIRAMLLVQGEILQVDRKELLNATTAKVKDIWLGNALSQSDQGMQHVIPHNASFQTEDLDTYDSDYDDLSTAQVVLMANICNYGSDIISKAQQDSIILSVIKHMTEQMINHVNNWEKANKEQNNESITAKLERYKERVKTFEQRLNIDLSSHEKMIDSQMDDMIREKLALKEQIDSLEQNFSKQIKEKGIFIQNFYSFQK